jgi:hypothetical protein
MLTIFEKLLPGRFWRKPEKIQADQFWTAMAAPENPQASALLHTAQDKFMSHIQAAAGVTTPEGERLRALDRAMAIADFMTEVEGNFAVAKAEVARREADKRAQQQQE